MLLVITAFALVASVPLAGGRLSRLADIRLRAVWTVFVSVVIQVGITTVVPGGSHLLHVALHLFSYVLAAWFLVANRHVTGILVVALGAGLNVLAISANGGVMPTSANAMRIAGLQPAHDFHNSALVAHPHLAFLGDVIPVPGPWPIGNVLSVGDLIIFAGALVILHRACGSRLPLLRPKAAAARP
jgi:hypothetical protein